MGLYRLTIQWESLLELVDNLWKPVVIGVECILKHDWELKKNRNPRLF